jgi:hypothetical protein
MPEQSIIALPGAGAPPVPVNPRLHMPPEYNGWGSEEDSLGSCVSLIPKPPKKDFVKAQRYDNTVLRFAAVLNTPRQVDRERRFVITYYLADDTLHVFEPHQRNSGIVGGKWLERSRVKVGARYLGTEDLHIGAEILLSGFPFVLIGADEYALRFMDQQPELFPKHTPRGKVSGTELIVSEEERGKVRFADPPAHKADHIDSAAE